PRLDVVGLCLSDQVRTLAGSNVVIHGRVADVAPFYNQARVFIVPTRFAAGIPHKAHEAAAHGLPMVTTALIASQLGWKDEVAVGQTARDFALHCAALHNVEALWSAKHSALLKAVKRDCSSAQFQATVRSIFSESVTTGSNA
ncbi:MAG TPA: glycosyltransferase family 4 protein, partial [Gemmatales bacterium]|nr:glycosyltransferase family 4 protein [Gemmatales bacterium]